MIIFTYTYFLPWFVILDVDLHGTMTIDVVQDIHINFACCYRHTFR